MPQSGTFPLTVANSYTLLKRDNNHDPPYRQNDTEASLCRLYIRLRTASVRSAGNRVHSNSGKKYVTLTVAHGSEEQLPLILEISTSRENVSPTKQLM